MGAFEIERDGFMLHYILIIQCLMILIIVYVQNRNL